MAAQTQVQVTQMSLSSQPAAHGAAVRLLEVHMELTGAYANIKLWLAEVLARRPEERALKRLLLRRSAGTDALQPTVDATVVVVLAEPVPSRLPNRP